MRRLALTTGLLGLAGCSGPLGSTWHPGITISVLAGAVLCVVGVWFYYFGPDQRWARRQDRRAARRDDRSRPKDPPSL